jgi:replication-associated recombination protein RarA
MYYEEIDANEMTHERLFEWRHLAVNPDMVLFIDEVQDLEPSQMRKLRKMIEGLRATMILTTTHREELEDALLNRLKSYEYRLVRPTIEDIVEFLERRCKDLGVQFSDRSQLARVAEGLNCEMRPCAEFPRKVLAETSDRRISDSYLDHVFGKAGASQPQPRHRHRKVI